MHLKAFSRPYLFTIKGFPYFDIFFKSVYLFQVSFVISIIKGWYCQLAIIIAYQRKKLFDIDNRGFNETSITQMFGMLLSPPGGLSHIIRYYYEVSYCR
jgi:hypothetical protein